jgi:hypothetical protein
MRLRKRFASDSNLRPVPCASGIAARCLEHGARKAVKPIQAVVSVDRQKTCFLVGEFADVRQTLCPMRQLSLAFGNEDRPSTESPQMKGRGEQQAAATSAVAEIAEDLGPRVISTLSDPASSPEEPSSQAAPPLIRPDRQFTFDGAPHYDWPQPEVDRDTITVDRIRDDIDGPSHRFVVKRGDTIEAFFSRNRLEIGEVVGISHARHEVRVRFGQRGKGIWFAIGQIYPVPEKVPESEQQRSKPFSAEEQQASSESTRPVTIRRA